ncbi:MAG: GIY-YIG nuclease family protein [Bacteroidota bacterium]
MYYLYILYSPSSDKYYVGQTNDIEARITDHNAGNRPEQTRKYTFKHRPWRLELSIPIQGDRKSVMEIERFIKNKKSRVFLERLIQAKGDDQRLAQLLRVPIEIIGINQ